MSLTIRSALLKDLDACFAIEAASYGPEGATKERIKNRIKRYPEGFLVAEESGFITGFINSCCSDDADLSNEELKAMVSHNSTGRFLIILSLVVSPEYRHKGYGRALLDEYLSLAKSQRKTVLLMCKEQHISLYTKFGFSLVKKSNSSHGGIEWFEMSYASNN